ncbi:MAG: hypothetical protein LBJ57_06390 [Prevotellaceae bacterium]|jgi:chromosomal replication initiation ATPase DnaA|nr:hypothetical protein [Prevotellaceae bacterium]
MERDKKGAYRPAAAIETVGSHRISPYAYAGIRRKERLTIAALEQLVCEAFGVSPASLHVKSRRRSACFPRHVLYYLAAMHRGRLSSSENSLEGIAAYFGQNHATVSHALQLIPSLMETNRQTRELVEGISQRVKESFVL